MNFKEKKFVEELKLKIILVKGQIKELEAQTILKKQEMVDLQNDLAKLEDN